jgi:hypothetical protein
MEVNDQIAARIATAATLQSVFCDNVKLNAASNFRAGCSGVVLMACDVEVKASDREHYGHAVS